jgi:hypothetical protein
MYQSNYLNSMEQTQGVEMVPGITDHQMILDTLSHPLQSPIRALQTFFGIALLAGSCSLPITTSLLFAAELFNQGAMIRAKVDEQLTAATGILGTIAGNLFGKTTKSPETGQKPDTTGTM